ncbi:MAG: 3-hydroxyacyl-CoA dehydrogenase family protein [Spirochaetales bacterium]|nr:3-hydroxyacyl-CoA dehydrogenase family protein [Spirochaetales bacterium]
MKIDGIDHIAIIGTGMIGSSQAALFTGNGYKTTMFARTDEKIEKGLQQYNKFFDVLFEKELITEEEVGRCTNYLFTTTNYSEIADADIIFECVPENIELKHNVYSMVEKYCTQYKAIASTTSAKSPDDLAEGFNKQKEKIMVAHPFYPPHLIPFVEIVKGTLTTNEAAKTIYDLLESCGRKPIIANKSVPGFVANRLQHALVREAANIVDQGIASASDVDKALMYSFAPRYSVVGLFQHQDAAGLDMVKSIQDYLLPDLAIGSKTPDLIQKNFDKGDLGMKTGKGIYEWPEEAQKEFHQKAAAPYFQYFNWDIPK